MLSKHLQEETVHFPNATTTMHVSDFIWKKTPCIFIWTFTFLPLGWFHIEIFVFREALISFWASAYMLDTTRGENGKLSERPTSGKPLNWTLYCQYLKDISISKFERILKRHHTIAMAQPEKFHICCGVGVQLSYFSRHMDWLSIRLPGGGLRNIWRLGKSHPPPTKTVKLTFVEAIRREV